MHNTEFVVVIGAHYQNNSSFNSDKAEIIRILGPGKNENSYVDYSGKTYSKYDIEENYTLLDTNYSEKPAKKKNHLFAGFERITEDTVYEAQNEIEEVYIQEPQELVEVENITTSKVKKETIKPKSFDIQILERLKNNSIKNELPINLKLITNFDISALRTIIDLMKIDKNEIARYLSKEILVSQNIESKLTGVILKLLDEKPIEVQIEKTVEVHIEPEEIVEKPIEVPIEPEVISDDVLEQLANIDKFINS